MLMIIQIFY